MAYRARNQAMDLHVHVHDADSTTPPRRGVVAFSSNDEAKSIWIVRHGEAEHNSSSDWGLRDPSLTTRGQKQARALTFHPQLREALGFVNKEHMAGLVVVSPLRRALQTAQMVAESMRGSTVSASHPWVPIVAHPDLQEMTDGPNDTGHPPQVLGVEFPEVDFDEVPDDWYDKRKEGNSKGLERALRFCEWLAARPETGIICIGHLDFFRELTGVTLKNCGAAHFIFSNGGWQCQHFVPKPKPPPSDSLEPPFLFTPKTVSSEARKAVMTPSSIRNSAMKGSRAEMYVGQDTDDTPITDSKDPHAEHTGLALFQLLLQRMELPVGGGESRKPVSVKPLSESAAKAASKAVFAFLDERGSPKDEEPAAVEEEEEPSEYLERGKIAGWLVELGVPARQAEQLVTHIACTGREKKKLKSLSHVVQGDFVQAVAHPKFLRLRLLLANHLAPPLILHNLSSPSLSHASTAHNWSSSYSRFSPSAARPPPPSRQNTAVQGAQPSSGGGYGAYFRSPLSRGTSGASTPSQFNGKGAGDVSSPSARRTIFSSSSQARLDPHARRGSTYDSQPTSPSNIRRGSTVSVSPTSQRRGSTIVSPTSPAVKRPASCLPWARHMHGRNGKRGSVVFEPDAIRPPSNGKHLPEPLQAEHRSYTGLGQSSPTAGRLGTPSRSGTHMLMAPPPSTGRSEAQGRRGSISGVGEKRRMEEEYEEQVWAAEQRVAQLAGALQAAQLQLQTLHTTSPPRHPTSAHRDRAAPY